MHEIPDTNPFSLFNTWLGDAEKTEPNDANALSLSTVNAKGFPSSRMVLLKGHDESGFTFYTNFESRKGKNILENPNVAILFHWKTLRRQIRIEGVAQQVPDEVADEYFWSRDRQSQIGAWASQQSCPLESRFALEKSVAKYAAKYAIGKIPRPDYWSGFKVAPTHMEFWQDGAFRLHDRFTFERDDVSVNDWTITRLYP